MIALEHELFELELVLLDCAQKLLFAHSVESVASLFERILNVFKVELQAHRG